jgi:uncharacterized protein involved in cysteine biosynthesis
LPRQGSSSYGGEEHLFLFFELSLAKEKVNFVLMVLPKGGGLAATIAQVTLRQNLNSLLFCDPDKDKNKTKNATVKIRQMLLNKQTNNKQQKRQSRKHN